MCRTRSRWRVADRSSEMSMLIDTAVVAPEDRAEFWAEAAGDAYHPCQIEADDRFGARMWSDTLASVGLFRLTAAANTMRRTRTHIDASDDATIHLTVVLRGGGYWEQGGRHSTLGPGDLTSYDASQPAVVHSGRGFDVLVLKMPKAVLGSDLSAKMTRLSSLRIAGDVGLPRLTRQFVCGAAAGLSDGSIRPDDAYVIDHVLELVRRVYLDLDATPRTHSRPQADLLLQSRAYIQAHLGDPELDPAQVARACFISTGYLHRVWLGEGYTVAEWIRSERLERCRRDLLDPALAHQSIAAVATRWGLPEPSHFSRLFRRAFDCSPREFRRNGGKATR